MFLRLTIKSLLSGDFGGCQMWRKSHIIWRSLVYHQFRRNWISPTRSVESHQAAEKCTLLRDDIQPEGLMLCTALRAVMICQACGLDKQKALADASAFCWRREWDSTRGLKSLPPAAFLRTAVRRPVRTLNPSTPNKKRTNLRLVRFFFGGGSGIRTHAPFRTNGFQDRLVMTTSISLRVFIKL